MDRIESGEVDNDGSAPMGAVKSANEMQVEETSSDTMVEPAAPEYILDMPSISPLDLYV